MKNNEKMDILMISDTGKTIGNCYGSSAIGTTSNKNNKTKEAEKFDAKELFSALWAAADEMRSVMSADTYKDYLLCLIFYKSLSDKYLLAVADLLEKEGISLQEAQKLYEDAQNGSDWYDLCNRLQRNFYCFIKPEFTFTSFYNQINAGTFVLDNLKQAFRDIEQSQGYTYNGLFDDFDVESKDLGKTPIDRNIKISSVIKALYDINFNKYNDDALGDAYEYLIAQFASESGKKAGEFYTPKAISILISRIVTIGKENKEGFSIYDPCCGSGSLLLQAKNFISKDYSHLINYFGQEIINQTYNLARMNFLLHMIPSKQQKLNNGDTLGLDWPQEEPTNYDAVCMNPPYSLSYSANPSLLSDPRFARYEKLPPKSTADYAFLLHGFYHLKTDGVMGIVLPHGVLFRSGAEGTIRKHLVEDGSIYAVIGLPANLFFNTSIPTCVIILKKNNVNRDVLFIDASKCFIKGKARNVLPEIAIDKIVQTYIDRKDVEKYAHLATFKEIKENDFNLNIPRYVDTFEEEPIIDLGETFKKLEKLNQEEKELNNTLNNSFKELGLSFMLGD